MDHVCHADTQQVESDHGRGEDAHVHDIGGRGNDGGNNKENQDGIAQVVPHPLSAHKAHQRKKEHQDRHLEDDAETENDGHKEIGVLTDRHHGLELRAVADEEIERRGKDDLVAEEAASHEKKYRAEHERQHVATLMLVKPRSDKCPNLVEDKRRSYENPAYQS